MLKDVRIGDDQVTLVFEDAVGRECSLCGLPADTETDPDTSRLMFGLSRLELLAYVNGRLKVCKSDAIALPSQGVQDVKLLRGAPMALTRAQVADLIPLLQHYVTHGTMPPIVSIEISEPETDQAKAD